MSAPESLEAVADVPEPAIEPARRRRLGARTIALIAGGAALLLIGGVIGGLLLASHLERQAAIDAYDAAFTEASDAADADRTADNTASRAHDALSAQLTAADAAIAVTGAGISPDDAAALQAARTGAEAALTEAPELVPAVIARVISASTLEELRETSDRFAARAEALRERTAASTDRADAADTASAALEAAGVQFADAVAASGAEVLAERDDAGDAAQATLQSGIDALGSGTLADLAERLTAYRAAVDAVVASSDEARRPVGAEVGDPASLTVVVNKRRSLPASYIPPGLVIPPGIPNNNGQPVRSELVAPLTRMQADMAAAGITLRIGSAYRSYATQQSIYSGFVSREGVAGADTHSARPGHSEHQTGLAVDLDDGTGCNLSRCFANTAGGRWLAANAWKYGFILRYGDGWTPIVGYSFEPWHYRFVGETVAADMHARGITTLEQYYGLPAAPDYG